MGAYSNVGDFEDPEVTPVEVEPPVRYHPKSGLPVEGYLGALTEEQEKSLEALRGLAREAELDLEKWRCKPAETEALLLLRFLRARKFDPPKAFAMLRTDIEWREAIGLEKMLQRSARDVLGCDLSIVFEYAPHHQQGHDRQGRPVLYEAYGNFEIAKVTPHTTLDKLMDFYTWEIERLCRMTSVRSARHGILVETFTIVIDLKGWSPRLATRDAFRYVQRKAVLDSAHFPERLGQVVMVNAPLLFAWAWKVISSWLDPRTQAKIRIMSGEDQWRPALQDLIDPSELLSEYGGLAERTPSALHEGDAAVTIGDSANGAAIFSSTSSAAFSGGLYEPKEGTMQSSVAAVVLTEEEKQEVDAYTQAAAVRAQRQSPEAATAGERRDSDVSSQRLWADDAFWRGLGAGAAEAGEAGGGGGSNVWWEGPLPLDVARAFYTPPSSPRAMAVLHRSWSHRYADNGESNGAAAATVSQSQAPQEGESLSGKEMPAQDAGEQQATEQDGAAEVEEEAPPVRNLAYFLETPSFSALQERLRHMGPLTPEDEAGLAELLTLHTQSQSHGIPSANGMSFRTEKGEGSSGGNSKSGSRSAVGRGEMLNAGRVPEPPRLAGAAGGGWSDPMVDSSHGSSMYATPRSRMSSDVLPWQQQHSNNSNDQHNQHHQQQSWLASTTTHLRLRHSQSDPNHDRLRKRKKRHRLRLLLACGGDVNNAVPPGHLAAGFDDEMPPLQTVSELTPRARDGEEKEEAEAAAAAGAATAAPAVGAANGQGERSAFVAAAVSDYEGGSSGRSVYSEASEGVATATDAGARVSFREEVREEYGGWCAVM